MNHNMFFFANTEIEGHFSPSYQMKSEQEGNSIDRHKLGYRRLKKRAALEEPSVIVQIV